MKITIEIEDIDGGENCTFGMFSSEPLETAGEKSAAVVMAMIVMKKLEEIHGEQIEQN